MAHGVAHRHHESHGEDRSETRRVFIVLVRKILETALEKFVNEESLKFIEIYIILETIEESNFYWQNKKS